ncbi:MAG: SMC-Scp complex subunit ScpB [Firmicutes bacterium]|jgi:segregation and condensation protein B|nr:SMC-Scp complex subunit ScpB [Bacillota bacterium]MBR6350717.1 SMC-Scp complex subunit ScpB [Bacillota bacterium]
MAHENIKSAVESLLFVWGDPLDARTLADLFNIPVSDMLHIMRDMMDEYEDRGSGLRIREMDKTFQLCTNPENDDYVQKLCTPVKEKRLSQPALEVLAVIAYKQPVTKAQIDAVRGIKSDRVLEGLMKKELVEEKGRSSAIGRPILYGTTKKFLALFGFETLKDLPVLDDVDDMLMMEDLDPEDIPTGQIALEIGDEA